jgi:hypothetical protein
MQVELIVFEIKLNQAIRHHQSRGVKKFISGPLVACQWMRAQLCVCQLI